MNRRAFTLVELLVTVSIIGLLAALLLPALRGSREKARAAVCNSNLRQLGMAVQMYLDDHGRYFPCFTNVGGDRLWYFGLESPFNPGGAPGARRIDLTKAKLFPYFRSVHSIEVCPSYDYRSARWRPKYDQITAGYGLNAGLFGKTTGELTNPPARTVCFADAANINTIQAPASSANPMLEEFYYVHPRTTEVPTTHFRHHDHANVLFCDGHVEMLTMAPGTLDQRMPTARVGRLNPDGDTSLFW